MFKFLAFLLLFALPALLSSQPAEPYHKVYNGDNCFPFPLLQSVYLDNEGLMWLSSSQKSGGVCVFNGEKCIKHFTEKDGLTDNVIPYIYIDGADTVYLAGFYHGLSVVYKNRVIKTYPIIEKYKCGPLNAIVKDTNGVLWVSTLNGRIFRIHNDSVREMKLPAFAKGLTMVFSAVTDKYNRVWFGAYSGHLFYYDNAQKKFVNAIDKFKIPQNEFNQLVLVNGYAVVSTSGDTASYIIEKDKKRVFSKDYDFYYNTDGYLTGMSYDSITVFRYENNSLERLFSVSVNYDFFDFNFLMTLFSGGNLYVIGENQVVEINPNVFVYGKSDGVVGINDFQQFGDSIWVVGKYWGYLKDDKFVSVREKLKKQNPGFEKVFRSNYTIGKTYKIGSKIYFSVTNERWFYLDVEKLKVRKVEELPEKFLLVGAGEINTGVKIWAGLNGIVKDSAGIREYYIFTAKGLESAKEFEPKKSLSFEKVYTFAESVWVPTSSGLIVYKADRGFSFLKDTVFTGKNTQLVRDKYGIVWFVNQNHFGYINQANYGVVTIDSVLDIVGHKSLYRFSSDGKGNIILASFYLEKDSVEIKSIVPVLYKNFAGRLACPFYSEGSYVYATLWDRIAKINIEGLANQVKLFKPRLDYLGVSLSGKDTSEVLSSDKFRVSSDFNSLKFDFALVNYLLSSSAFEVKYRLNGYEEDWHKVENVNHFEIGYVALPAGDYKLEVVLITKLGQEYDRKEVSFSIVPHFYETLWFKALVFLLIIVIAVYFAYKVAERKKQKEINLLTLQRQLNKMKYEFLQYKMEPHFVFNVLSSIKYLIIDNKQDEAGNAISDFSVLIRSLMTFGDTDFISLEEEVEFLKKFLALEKLRFDDKFEYEINVDNSCKDADILIPPMIIQPLAENAIKHGFVKGNKEGGKLQISFVCNGDRLTVTVKDNGKGFDMLAGVFKEDHALGLIKKRIAIYKELYDTEIEFCIKSEPGKGTEAKILI